MVVTASVRAFAVGCATAVAAVKKQPAHSTAPQRRYWIILPQEHMWSWTKDAFDARGQQHPFFSRSQVMEAVAATEPS